MPENTIYVGRPTRWGNPFKAKRGYEKIALRMYRLYVKGQLSKDAMDKILGERKQAYHPDAELAIIKWNMDGQVMIHAARKELRGKDVACWCPVGKPCHADILLRIVNKEKKEMKVLQESR
jgi:hypothetical protein